VNARRLVSACLIAALPLVAACDFGIRLSGSPPVAKGTVPKGKPTGSAVALDPIGDKPVLAAPKPFEPAPPQVFQTASGLTVWLVERPELPVVTASMVVPYGSAVDPEDKPGAMALLADMLDEGAGKRSALELSELIASAGASLGVSAGVDGSTATLVSLRSKFDTTFEVLADVVARPRFEQDDFGRVKKLWKNTLKKRSDDPMAVGSVVAAAISYGPKAPYGHPSLGLLSKADGIELGTLKAAYKKSWRPDRATLVVAGQITKKELEALIDKHLGSWKPEGDAFAAPKLGAVVSERPKLVVVDRPKAVQTVIIVQRDGVSASDERAPGLSLVNDALGGSFTSRLNTNLREEKGWTYGIGSSFTATRGQGVFTVRTSVDATFTGAAVKEILRELDKLAAEGLTESEVAKVKAQDRGGLIETYEAVTGTAGRLAQLVTSGLPASFDASASRLRQASSQADLARLAKDHVAPRNATVILVGDRALIETQMKDAGLLAPIAYGVEGQRLDKK
jgi:zinc protease